MYRNGVSVQASKASVSLLSSRMGKQGLLGVKNLRSLAYQLVDSDRPLLVLRRHLVVSGRTAGRPGLQRFLAGICFCSLAYDFRTCFSLFFSEAWVSNSNKLLVCDRHLLSAYKA